MNSHLNWLTSEQTILLLTVPEYWSLDEMEEWLQDIEQILNNIDEAIWVILDFQYSTYIPPNVIPHIQPVLNKIHPMAERIIFARLSIAHRAVFDMTSRLYMIDTRRVFIIEHEYVEDILNPA